MNELSFQKKWMRTLSQYDITQNDFDNKREMLTKQFGKEASVKDTIWGLFNNLITKEINNFQSLKMIYFEMALFVNEQGKDSMHLQKESRKMELLNFKKEGYVSKVEILANGGACENCRKQNGKVYKIEEALESMPIPCEECTSRIENKRKPWCECVYLPKVE